jgi:hypothetical protein
MNKAKVLKTVLVWIALALGILVLTQLKFTAPLYDYVAYWSAGRLNLQGLNPYDPNQLLALQRQVGWTLAGPLMTWYPPWALVILMPLSVFNYGPSRLLWFLVSVVLLVFAISQSWKLYGGSPRKIWLGLIIGLLFTPTLLALLLGQTSPWILIGVVGFLSSLRKPRGLWTAGLWAGLISIKPQLLYLFWIALLLWSLQKREWRVILGSAAAITLGLIGASLFNPNVIFEYLRSIREVPPEYLATPTFGFWLRAIFGYEKFWLQFLPPLLGTAWFCIYWWGKRQSWDWFQEIPILLFVSIITSSYAWNHDQLVLIPSLIQAVILLLAANKNWRTAAFLLIFLSINYANLLIHQRLDESWTIWMGPVLFGLYLAVCRGHSQIPALPEKAPA